MGIYKGRAYKMHGVLLTCFNFAPCHSELAVGLDGESCIRFEILVNFSFVMGSILDAKFVDETGIHTEFAIGSTV